MTEQTTTTETEAKRLLGDITSYIYGIGLLLTLSSVMLLVHLYLAFFFHA